MIKIYTSLQVQRLYMEGIIQEDPNYLCAYFAFGVIAALQQILSREKFFGKIWPIVELAIYLYVVVLTGSRGGLIAIMAGILMYFLYTGNRSAKGIVLKISAMVRMLDLAPMYAGDKQLGKAITKWMQAVTICPAHIYLNMRYLARLIRYYFL